jgi:hypothetical protein
MTVEEINSSMSPHPQMERTITTLNVRSVKLDKFLSIFRDDFFNNEITII